MKLDSFRQDNLLTDFKINVGETQFSVHSVIMAEASNFFGVAINSYNSEEKKGKKLTLQYFDSNIVEIAIRFIYMRSLVINDCSLGLLRFADKYEITSLLNSFEKHYPELINIENFHEYLSFSNNSNMKILKLACLKFAAANSDTIVKQDNRNILHDFNSRKVFEILTAACSKIGDLEKKDDDNRFDNYLPNLLKFNDYMDVEFHLKDGIVRAHRVILATASDIFLQCFQNKHDSFKFEMDKYCNVTVNSVVNFIYNRKLNDENFTVELIEFAHEYKIQTLIAHLEQIPFRVINSKNVLEFYVIGGKIGLKNLMNSCIHFLSENKNEMKEIIASANYDTYINDNEIVQLLLNIW